jgi:O-methyltransferase domain
MLEAYDFSAIHLLADIGGGNGSLIGPVLQRIPNLRASCLTWTMSSDERAKV